MRVVALVQARLGSTRLPRKVLRPIAGSPMIELLLMRLSKSSQLDQIVVVTSTKEEDNELQEFII